MNLETRRYAVLEVLRHGDHADVKDLAAHFNVSDMTIRRDLDWLEDQGLALRTHGGAVSMPPGLVTFRFDDERMARAAARKDAIAAEAVRQVEPGMQILLDTGTTTLRMTTRLRDLHHLTVLTTSLAVAADLYAFSAIDVLLLGGTVRENSPDLTGGLTEENLSRFRVDIAFVGADGADPNGVYCNHTEAARLSERMIASAEKTTLMLDSDKFQHPAFMRFATWQQIDTVITDDQVRKTHRTWLERCRATVVYVPTMHHVQHLQPTPPDY